MWHFASIKCPFWSNLNFDFQLTSDRHDLVLLGKYTQLTKFYFRPKRTKKYKNTTRLRLVWFSSTFQNQLKKEVRTQVKPLLLKLGQGWIRTTVVSRRQIYSLLPLASRAPTHINLSSYQSHEPLAIKICP